MNQGQNLLKSTILIAFLISTMIYTQGTGNPCRDKHCVRCDATGGCLKCIGRIRNSTNSGYCDSEISQSNCASWSYAPHSYCETCKPGYLINENNQCAKSTISCCKQGSVVNG